MSYMELFTHLDKALTKATEFVNTQTIKNAGWGKKADAFFKQSTTQAKAAAETAREKTAETLNTVSEKVADVYSDLISPENTSTDDQHIPYDGHNNSEPEPENKVTIDIVEVSSKKPTPAKPKTKKDTTTYTLPELKALAKSKGLKGYSTLNKKQLQELLGL